VHLNTIWKCFCFNFIFILYYRSCRGAPTKPTIIWTKRSKDYERRLYRQYIFRTMSGAL